jgi:hypothetical protein
MHARAFCIVCQIPPFPSNGKQKTAYNLAGQEKRLPTLTTEDRQNEVSTEDYLKGDFVLQKIVSDNLWSDKTRTSLRRFDEQKKQREQKRAHVQNNHT